MSATAEQECGSLWEALGRVRDHRRREGQRYPLAGLLLIAVAALLAGRRDQLGIVRWGRQLSASALASLGITRGRVPAPSVWCELFQGLDITSLEAALGDWVRGGQSPGHIAIDGKRLRGSATAQAPGVHLLAAFSDALGGVIGQLQMPPDSNEITAALTLLKTLPLAGCIVTGDAIFTQKEICRVIQDGGGDYFFTVKANQPELQSDIALAFARRFPPVPHGRHRLTSARHRRLAKGMAASKPARSKRPAPWPPILARSGPAWHKSAGSPAAA